MPAILLLAPESLSPLLVTERAREALCTHLGLVPSTCSPEGMSSLSSGLPSSSPASFTLDPGPRLGSAVPFCSGSSPTPTVPVPTTSCCSQSPTCRPSVRSRHQGLCSCSPPLLTTHTSCPSSSLATPRHSCDSTQRSLPAPRSARTCRGRSCPPCFCKRASHLSPLPLQGRPATQTEEEERSLRASHGPILLSQVGGVRLGHD